MLGLFTSAAYTIPIRTGFFRALAAGTFELAGSEKNREGDRVSDVAQSKSRIQISAYVASPEIGFGRFISGVTVLRRALHYQDDRLVYLGSSGMLRGYKPNALSGNDLLVSNSEFRTRPIQLFSILAGLDLFYDIGDAPARLSHFKLRQGGGAGVRVVLPQLNRDVFRVDFGFPLQNDPKGEFTITAGFKQVFGAPSARPDVLLAQ
jgi:outer membrane protein assembly factor BamA